MNRSSKPLVFIFALLLLAGLGYGVWWLWGGAVRLVEAAAPVVGAGVLLASATALLCSWILARGLGARRTDELRDNFARTYEEVLRARGSDTGARLERVLVLHGSKAVLLRFLETRKSSTPEEAERAWQRLLIEMRKDLGHRDGLPLPCEVLDLIHPGEEVDEAPTPTPSLQLGALGPRS